MRRLGDDARRVLREAGMPEAGELAEITRAWPAAVGDAISRSAWPSRVGRDGTLHVATVSATWAFELDRLSGELAERLTEALGARAPRALRFAPGNVPAPAAEPTGRASRARPEPGERERREGASLAEEISDDELRKLVARAASASLAKGRDDHRF